MPKLNKSALLAITISMCAAVASAQRYTDQRYDLALIHQQSSIEPNDVATGDDVGASLAMSAEYIVIGTPGRDVDGNSDAGCVYVYDTQSEALLFTLTSPTPGVGDEFGFPVALDGDLLCIGARNDDELINDGGAVFLFNLATGSIIEKLLPDNPEAIDRFGSSISISGDYVAVGVVNDDELGENVGSIEVFDRNTLARLGKLLPDDPTDISGLGHRVAISGNTLISTTYAADLGGQNTGAALAFDLPTLSHLYTVQGHDTAPHDEFGRSLAVSSDRFYVGAENNDYYGTDGGAVYMFDLATGEELAQMWPHDFDDGNNFGSSLHVEGDHLIIGARRRGGVNVGRVYLFNARTGRLQARFGRTAASGGDQFGVAVTALGDEVIASSVRARADGNFGGKIYRFMIGDERYPDRIFEGGDCTNDNSDEFGMNVAIDGTILAVTSEDNGLCYGRGGGVQIFDITTMELLRVVLDDQGDLVDSFGFSADVGEGILAIGAPNATDDAGAVYLYDVHTGKFIMTLAPDDLQAYDQFGYSICIDQGLLAVGALYGGNTGANSGAVYLFELSSGILLHRFQSPTPGTLDYFGFDIHMENSMLLVGSPRDDDAYVGAGAVFLYDLETYEYLRTYLPSSVPGAIPRDFGRSVHLSGDLVLVGDPSAQVDDTVNGNYTDVGLLSVFKLDTSELITTLVSAEPRGEEHFAWSVVADEDTIYVGTRRDPHSGYWYDTGQPVVHRFNRQTFERVSPAVSSYGHEMSWFGSSLAISDEYVAIGMPSLFSILDYRTLGGAVFVYDKPQGNACPADLNGDGELNFFDVSAFIVAFVAGDLAVDFNSDGELNFFDVSAFIVAYSGGCP
jgi:outer membrane protein assembly factor BamB